MNDVITLGEAMVLFVPTRAGLLRYAHQFERFVAGAESNLAIGLSRIGHRVSWISRVGDDEFGQHILAFLRGEQVDVSRVRVDAGAPTGVFFKERRSSATTRVYYYRAGSAASRLSPGDLDPEYIAQARFLHLTGITPALSSSCREAIHRAIEIARDVGVAISFDPNIRLKLWTMEDAVSVLRDLIPDVQLVLTSAEEAAMLTGERDPERAARELLEMGPSQVVVKLGADGALGATAEQVVHAAGIEVEVMETVGAGDAFNAGFLSGQLRGWDLEASLRLGNIMGALATTASGDVEGLPNWDEIQPYLGGNRPADR